MDKTMLTGILVDKTDDHVKILCQDELDNTYTLSVALMAYDEDKRKYVDDADVMANALDNLASIGLPSLDTIELDILDHVFEAYADVESARASFKPIRKFIRYNRIEAADAKALEKMSGQIFPTLETGEYKGVRFNIGISAEVKGELKNFRISQFRVESDNDDEPDRFISTKYASKDAENFSKALENNDSLTDEQKARIQAKIDTFNDRARAAKVEELETELGFNVDKLIASGRPLEVTVRVKDIPGAGVYFLVADLLTVPELDDIELDDGAEAVNVEKPAEKPAKKK